MGGVQVGWRGVGEWEDECPVNGGDGERLLSNFLQPLLEKFTIRSCNDGSRELIPVIHNPHRKDRPSPAAVALTMEYLVGVPSKAATSGREKNKSGSTSKNVTVFNVFKL